MAETQTEVKKRNVLIPMDQSEHSDRAFRFYMDNIYRKGDHIILLYVHEYHHLVSSPMAMTDVAVMAELMEEEKKRLQEFAEHLTKRLKDIGGKVVTKTGKPGEVIVTECQEREVTMVVMGSRGLGTLRRTFIGSVSDYVIHHSHVPVVVVNPQK